MRAALAAELGGIDCVQLGELPDPAPAAGQVVEAAGAGAGETVLITAAAGGVGSAAVQIAGRTRGKIVPRIGQ